MNEPINIIEHAPLNCTSRNYPQELQLLLLQGQNHVAMTQDQSFESLAVTLKGLQYKADKSVRGYEEVYEIFKSWKLNDINASIAST